MTDSDSVHDLAIIGGGINGCGIARDAAGRGLKVLLAERGDLARGTSSASTKLIHGGLRYLEYYEFRLVREALAEREVLLAMAPHIIRPMRFVLPHHRALRPAWLIRLGLFLYDHLGGRKLLPASRSLDLRSDAAGQPLKPEFRRGFEYSDCWVDDSRLVVLNAVDAARRGADLRVGTEVRSARREGGLWTLELANRAGRVETVRARALVNAAGPWVSDVIAQRLGIDSQVRTRLVKGSHIVVGKLFDHDRAYIFQHADQRIIFAIPYEDRYTLIGTTDVDFTGDLEGVRPDASEIDYLCAAAGEYFATPLRAEDVVRSFAGVRPLYDDGRSSAQQASRDYVLDLQGEAGAPPLLNIFGGKITTYRRLAEEAMRRLAASFPDAAPPWTAGSTLPGGDFPVGGLDDLAAELAGGRDLPDGLIRRLARSYGTAARDILAGVTRPDDLGRHFGADLYQREVEHLMRVEWAHDADDVVWRRSKLGLGMTADEIRRLDDWLAENRPPDSASAA